MSTRRRPQLGTAFSRVSGLPPSYFEAATALLPKRDVSALHVFLALRTAARRIENVVGGWLQPSNLTLTKMDVLQLLAATSSTGATVGTLREFLKMTQPNVTFVVHSLERDGLVERAIDPGDRRSSVVRITLRGSTLIEALAPRHIAAIGKALRAIPERERQRFVELLALMAERFEASPEQH